MQKEGRRFEDESGLGALHCQREARLTWSNRGGIHAGKPEKEDTVFVVVGPP